MNRGFSLIELLLVTAMLSVLTAVVAPSFSSWRARHLVARESRRVQRALEHAYILSLLRSTPVTLSIQTGGIAVTVADHSTLFSMAMSRDVSLQLKSKEQHALTFYPSHTVTPTTILVTNPRAMCSVILSLRGRTRRECSW